MTNKYSTRLLSSSKTSPALSPKEIKSLLEKEYANEEHARKLLIQLNNEINYHDDLYYNQAQPILDDLMYDRLRQKAVEIVTKYQQLQPLFQKYHKVGSPISPHPDSNSQLYVHNFPMLSLENTFDENGIKKFINDIYKHYEQQNQTNKSIQPQFSFERKIDGVSLSLKYVGGQFLAAGTRGDGKIGEDVTRHIPSILDIPITLPTSTYFPSFIRDNPSFEIEIRGEVYMTDKEFHEAQVKNSEIGMKQFSTPRNTVAGTLRVLDSNITAQRKLRFIAYGFYIRNLTNNTLIPQNLIACSSKSMQLPSQSQTLEVLSQLGFVVPHDWTCLSIPNSEEGLTAAIRQCQQAESNRGELGYDTDGVVIKVDDVSLQEELGFRQRSPKWAIAYKFTPKSAITKLLQIDIQIGRSGVLTPVAILSPVMIGGVKVERATLHNLQQIKRLGIRPGQLVRVQRSGDVIPKIMEGIQDSTSSELEPYEFPKFCPVCNSPVTASASVTSGDEDQTHRCTGGWNCQAQVVEKLRHFCSKGAANIKGLAGATLETLVTNKLITYPSELYSLEQRQRQLALDRKNNTSLLLSETKGWGPVSIRNLFDSIEKSRSITCARLIFALGIPDVGEKTAKDIADAFQNDFNAFWTYVTSEADLFEQNNHQSEFASKISAIPGVGPVVLNSLLNYSSLYVHDPNTTHKLNPLREEVNKLMSFLHHQTPTAADPPSSPLTNEKNKIPFLFGKRLVFSGKLLNMTRNEACEVAERYGAQVDKQITSQTNLIVVPALSAAEGDMSSKMKKAKEKGIEIWTELEWQERLEKEKK